MYINYNEYDLHLANDFIQIQEFLGGREINDSQVWEKAREYEEMPIFENIWYELTLSEITYMTKEKYNLDIDYYINARDTHLHAIIDNERYDVACYESFKEIINQLELENEKTI